MDMLEQYFTGQIAFLMPNHATKYYRGNNKEMIE